MASTPAEPVSSTASTPCAVASLAAAEPAVGTAVDAGAWVGLEQPGPWGRDALTDSRLPADLARRFGEQTTAAGARPTLLRRPGAHPDVPGPRTVLIARGGTTPWLLEAVATSPDVLAGLQLADLPELLRGDPRDLLALLSSQGFDARLRDGRVILICTHARRDRCCAVLGRPVVDRLRALRPRAVWEASHTGGHRFAPTGVVLPDGLVLGRLTVDLALDVLDAPPDTLPPTVLDPRVWRGHSSLTAGEQVVELHARLASGDLRAGAYRPASGVDLRGRVGVTDHDGALWTARVTDRETGPDRAPSCGAQPQPFTRPEVDELRRR